MQLTILRKGHSCFTRARSELSPSLFTDDVSEHVSESEASSVLAAEHGPLSASPASEGRSFRSKMDSSSSELHELFQAERRLIMAWAHAGAEAARSGVKLSCHEVSSMNVFLMLKPAVRRNSTSAS